MRDFCVWSFGGSSADCRRDCILSKTKRIDSGTRNLGAFSRSVADDLLFEHHLFGRRCSFRNGISSFQIFDQKTDSIDPEYNFGAHVKALYRVPPTRNALSVDYTYLLNNGTGHLKSDNSFVRQDGVTQRNIQDDRGYQHFHLHIVDLLASRLFPMYENITFLLGGGLTYNDFNYFFGFHDQADVSNFSKDGTEFYPVSTVIKSQRKTDGWGLGPKIEWHFGFHFTKMDWNHDVGLNFSLQLATLFSKLWSCGKFSIDGFGSEGNAPVIIVASGKWNNGSKFQVIPNVNLDLSFRYKYETANNVSFMVTAGYKTYLYWELREFNRTISYRLDSTNVVGDVANSEKDTLILAGPYLRFTVGF